MSKPKSEPHPVVRQRARLGWSQEQLAEHSGVPRTTLSAIEGRRLTPSVTAALAVARALECSVEELFGDGSAAPSSQGPQWAWSAPAQPSRYWTAEVGGRHWLYPVESLAVNPIPHDGVWHQGVVRSDDHLAASTLVIATCDPAAGLLAAEFARESGFRLLVLQRGGGTALELLRKGLVHVAGIHRTTQASPTKNAETVKQKLGGGYRLLRAAEWEEGLAVSAATRSQNLRSITRQCDRWALREPGSAARECLDEILSGHPPEGRIVASHAAVAEAVHSGWASAGVCVRLSAVEAGLNFIPVRTESLDLCFSDAMAHDPRVHALIRLVRSRDHRRLVSDLPGYDAKETGGITRVS
ncbi:MAG: substrate-binding domain-containing protein [Verrucomicrobiota bacterium]